MLFGTPQLNKDHAFIAHASSFHSSSHLKEFPLRLLCCLLIPQVILSICLDTAQIVYAHIYIHMCTCVME